MVQTASKDADSSFRRCLVATPFGQTVDEALLFIKEAIALYIEGLIENGQPIPIEPEPYGKTIASVLSSLKIRITFLSECPNF